MDKLTYEQWHEILSIFCRDCFMFWKRQGCSIAVAFDKARKETLQLKCYPFAPKGPLINKKALEKWGKQYNQKLVDTLYEYEKNDSIGDLRTCFHCGFPVFDGYYIYADFYCCEKCATEGGYGGNKEEFEKDLKEAESEMSPLWSEVYYSQWNEPVDE